MKIYNKKVFASGVFMAALGLLNLITSIMNPGISKGRHGKSLLQRRISLAAAELPGIFSFLRIGQQLSVKFDDHPVISIAVLGHIHIQPEIDGAHDGISALFMDDILDGRAIGVDDLVQPVKNRIGISLVGMGVQKCCLRG